MFSSPTPSTSATPVIAGVPSMAARYRTVRSESQQRAAPLSAEDQCVQSMPDASPSKWHLAHTTWFFETVVLRPHVADYQPFDTRYFYLFNSYYEALGPRHPRAQRGLLTRPALAEIHAYRAHVDAAMQRQLQHCSAAQWQAIGPLVELGLHHEQQHQELLLTDALHLLSCNPMLPAYLDTPPSHHAAPQLEWLEFPGGTTTVGHAGPGFAFDNETPRHRVLLQPFSIANRLVTCGEYAQFITDGGYQRAEFWLSDGWAQVLAQDWRAPAYWLQRDDPRLPDDAADGWHVFGLHGVRPMDAAEPVSQLSFFEAAAYAEWAGARLPTEFEWEAAASQPGMHQRTGHVWQWTRSSYDPYPGFRPHAGAVGEYNGKFMVGQLVLRGGSRATPEGHLRASYRNFFPAGARWQFSGLRLARDGTC